MLSRLVLLLTVCPTVLNAAAPPGPSSAPLHQRIDALLEAAPNFRDHDAGQASDAEFFRRVHLDLTGRIPTANAVRAFLADRSPSKRRAVIDQLLASPEYARRMATVFDVMLLERRLDRQVRGAEWDTFLRKAFAENRPWDETAREILSADDRDPKKRYRAKFFLERAAEPHLVTRDISRLFLGTDFQCAQCHDHPLVADYHQSHYYGIFAFVNRTSLVTDRKRRVAMLSEKANGEVTFQSVFDPKKVTHTTLPRVPGGKPLADPKIDPKKAYTIPPAKGKASMPRYSRRLQLAAQIARADYAPFRRNIANRLWALMMGRGLIEPLDMDHLANPPTNPELLEELATDLAAHKFDVKWFLREIALSRAYQRSSVQRDKVDPKDAPPYAVAELKPLSAEQLAFAIFEATGLMETNRLSLGKKATEAALYARVASQVPQFVKAFGAMPGNPDAFDARMDQALFLANGPTVRSWLISRPGNLVGRLEKLSGDARAEELYLSILGRRPEAEERQEVVAFLKKRPKALSDLAWALLASAEFRFNH